MPIAQEQLSRLERTGNDNTEKYGIVVHPAYFCLFIELSWNAGITQFHDYLALRSSLLFDQQKSRFHIFVWIMLDMLNNATCQLSEHEIYDKIAKDKFCDGFGNKLKKSTPVLFGSHVNLSSFRGYHSERFLFMFPL